MFTRSDRERRVRNQILYEYLMFRRIREGAWRQLRAADASDAERLRQEEELRQTGRLVFHDYNADLADRNRRAGERDLAVARAGIESLNNIRSAMSRLIW
jgi:hypothetical protein